MTGTDDWAGRAQLAADTVNTVFGHQLLRLPGTWIAHVENPPPRPTFPWSNWDYWWQAHYLDALIDQALRQHHGQSGTAAGPEATQAAVPTASPEATQEVSQEATQTASQTLDRAKALLRGIKVRNFDRFPNYFFDDMAWLALASNRLENAAVQISGSPYPQALGAAATLGRQLLNGWSTELGGGIFWSRKRDFKNTPSNGPAALFFGRTGNPAMARGLADWLRTELFDPTSGLYLDGVHPNPAGPVVERTIYSYNQGPILAALLQLGDPQSVGRAADLIAAVALHLTVQPPATYPDQNARPLQLYPGGDGGLFTGILVRYLALAAADPRLPQDARDAADAMVRDTAAALWAGRHNGMFSAELFPQAITGPALLSVQVQGWTVCEAAATRQPA